MTSSEVVTPSAMASTRASTDYLDGFRGLLILIVLQVHIFYLTTHGYFETGRVQGPLPWYFEIVRWFFPALSLVGMFVVVSGYCLMLPLARSVDGQMVGGVLKYLKRRARRILPPYYAAALLSLAHTIFLSSEYHPRQNPLHVWNLISHVFVFYNFDFRWRFQINGPYWSLAPEWQLYILFPIVLVPLWRKTGAAGLMAAGVLGTIGLMLVGKNVRDMHPWYLFLFVLGMVAALATESKDARISELRDRVPWVLLSLVLFGAVFVEWAVLWFFDPAAFHMMPPMWQIYCGDELLMGTAIAAAIIHWTRVRRSQPAAQWPHVLRFLHHKWVMLLGRFSYSHYLVHYPILITTSAIVLSFHLPLVETVLLSYVISIPASLGLSYLFFLAVENRFLPGRQVRMERAELKAIA